MLKKLGGKILPSKFRAVSLVTEHTVEQKRKVLSTRATVKNSITSASIVPEVWIMFGLLLSLATRTGLGNPRDHK